MNEAHHMKSQKNFTRLKEHTMLSGLIALLLSVTFCVFGPLEIVLASPSEFWFRVTEILPLVAVAFGVVFVAVFLILFFLSAFSELIFPALFGLGVALYVQGNYILTDYGIMDGTAIDWNSFGTWPIVNTLIWIALIGVPVVLFCIKRALSKQIILYVSAGIVAVQLITLSVVCIHTVSNTASSTEFSEYTLTNSGRWELSEKENTIVFILDCYDSQVFHEFIDTYSGLKESLFSDFIYYPDTAGGATRTMLALPYILTGQPYTSQNGYENYIRNGFSATKLYEELRRRDYDLGIYTSSKYVSPEIEDILVNFQSGRKQVASYSKLAYYLYRLTAARYFPHVLKEYVWMYSGDFDAAADQSGSDEASYITDDAAFYQSLTEHGITLQNENNAFRVYHLMGAHEPYTLNEMAQRSAESTSLEAQQLGVMTILDAYFSEMKELGIYDSANIIVMADHGDYGVEQNPVFLLKRGSETTQFTISDMPISYANLHPTFIELIGGESDGISVFEVNKEHNSRRLFYQSHSETTITEYEILGHASNIDNVHKTGQQYSMLDLTSSVEYTLGDVLYFDIRATGHKYIVNGFSGIETTHTWTDGNSAELAIPLKDKNNKELLVSVSLAMKMRASQRVGVYVNDLFLNWYNVSGDQLNFVVPAEEDRASINIRFVLPDAVSPAEVSTGATDPRRLSLGIFSMSIREMQEQDVETEILDLYVPEEILFNKDGNCNSYLGIGWHGQESIHRWTSESSEVKLLVNWDSSQTLEITSYSFAFSGDTEVYCNDTLIGTIINNGQSHTEVFTIPEECISGDGIQTITFVTKQATSPKEVGMSDDERVLGLAVQSLKITEQLEP